jgi:Domain of unknown function (DUF4411)
VYDEILATNNPDDPLVEWVKARKDIIFDEPDWMVQHRYRDVAEYVNQAYERHRAAPFLDEADPWLIAHAMFSGGVVVTNEKRAAPSSGKPKIPDICDYFAVESITRSDMLRRLKVTFALEGPSDSE